MRTWRAPGHGAIARHRPPSSRPEGPFFRRAMNEGASGWIELGDGGQRPDQFGSPRPGRRRRRRWRSVTSTGGSMLLKPAAATPPTPTQARRCGRRLSIRSCIGPMQALAMKPVKSVAKRNRGVANRHERCSLESAPGRYARVTGEYLPPQRDGGEGGGSTHIAGSVSRDQSSPRPVGNIVELHIQAASPPRNREHGVVQTFPSAAGRPFVPGGRARRHGRPGGPSARGHRPRSRG